MSISVTAKILLHGQSFGEALAESQRIAAAEGRVFVHAFNDKVCIRKRPIHVYALLCFAGFLLEQAVVAGQGTVALEIMEQNPYLV